MYRCFGLVIVAIVVAALRVDARACKPAPTVVHTVDTSMQATDQTPPTLPAIPAPTFLHVDGSPGCGGSDCGDADWIEIPAVATDDMTSQYRIGYRLSLESGELPTGVTLPATAIEPNGDFVRVFFDPAAAPGSSDFTLQVVAIDLAGNESAPQSVRVLHQSDGQCALAGAGGARSGLGWIALCALIVTAYRRGRR